MQSIIERVKYNHNKLIAAGYNVFYTGAYGSMNYDGLFNYDTSDVDTKSLVLPTKRNLILGRRVESKDIPIDSVPPSLAIVKDIRDYFDCVVKMNPAFLEPLYTCFAAFDNRWLFAPTPTKIKRIIDAALAENPYKLLHSTLGMMNQKYHALTKPFQSKMEVINKYGYDPKQLTHIARLYDFLTRIVEYGNFQKALEEKSDDAVKIKYDPPRLELAQKFADQTLEKAENFVKEQCALHPFSKEKEEKFRNQLNDLAVEIITKGLNL